MFIDLFSISSLMAAEGVYFECNLTKVDYGKEFVAVKRIKTKGEMKIKNNKHRSRRDLKKILALLLIIAESHIKLSKHRF